MTESNKAAAAADYILSLFPDANVKTMLELAYWRGALESLVEVKTDLATPRRHEDDEQGTPDVETSSTDRSVRAEYRTMARADAAHYPLTGEYQDVL